MRCRTQGGIRSAAACHCTAQHGTPTASARGIWQASKCLRVVPHSNVSAHVIEVSLMQ